MQAFCTSSWSTAEAVICPPSLSRLRNTTDLYPKIPSGTILCKFYLRYSFVTILMDMLGVVVGVGVEGVLTEVRVKAAETGGCRFYIEI